MIRRTLFVLTTLATTTAAIAAVAPVHEEIVPTARNVTVIEKNQAFPVYGPIVVEQCATQDCLEVQS